MWDYISDNTAIVIELENLKNYYKKKSESGFLDNLAIVSNDGFLPLLIQNDSLKSSTEKIKLLISIHPTSDNQIGLVTYLSLLNKNNQAKFYSIIEKIKKEKNLTPNERIYKKKIIYELKNTNFQLSYIVDNNMIAISSNSFLIEDVIRTISNNSINTFKNTNYGVMSMPKSLNNQGNIHLNYKKTNKLINIFINNPEFDLGNFAKSSSLDFNTTENLITFNGFTNNDTTHFLDTFKGQKPVNDDFNNYIPNEAISFSKFLVNQPNLWNNSLEKYWQKNEPIFLERRNKLLSDLDIDIDQIFSWIKDGICVIDFEESPNVEQMLLISTKDVNESLNQMNKIAQAYAKIQEDSLYVEKYDSFLIIEMGVPNFPDLVWDCGFHTNGISFYMVINNILVFGTSIEVLKNLIDNMENEDTYGKNMEYIKFNNKSLREVNYSYTFNARSLISTLANNLNLNSSKLFNDKNPFKFITLQYSNNNSNLNYTNILVQKSKSKNKVEINNTFSNLLDLNVSNYIITKPYVVKNELTKKREIILQDSSNTVHLINNSGEISWSTKIEDNIISPITQIDYFNNEKLQYFFATENSLYVLDKNGNIINGFPMSFNYKISGATIIDYDKSKRYRFLIADDSGNLYLYNQYGVNLEGWNPFPINKKLSFLPYHQRIRGRDCYIYLTTDGILNVVTRKGKSFPNFPVNLNDIFQTNIYIEKKHNFDNSIMHILSKSGKYFKIAMSGKILSSEYLYKNTKETVFKLIPDVSKKTYTIVRQEKRNITFLNKDFKEIMSKDYTNTSDFVIQFYYFSNDNQAFVITDENNNLTYIYDYKGTLINSYPFNSSQKIGLLYSRKTNKYSLFKVFENNCQILTY